MPKRSTNTVEIEVLGTLRLIVMYPMTFECAVIIFMGGCEEINTTNIFVETMVFEITYMHSDMTDLKVDTLDAAYVNTKHCYR